MHDANTGADVLKIAFSTNTCCFGGKKRTTMYDATGRLIGKLESGMSLMKFSMKAIEWNVTIFTVEKASGHIQPSAGGTRTVAYEVPSTVINI